MTVLGYVAILAGVLLIRQVAVGRALETPDDIRGMFVAALQGDFSGVKTITGQRGSAFSPGASASASSASFVPGGSSALLSEMHRLGDGKPYVYGAQGPAAYDCSGLVWRALYNLGVYRGPRFTAGTSMLSAMKGKMTEVTSPTVGDIVLWSGHHVGVVSGPDRMFSARSSDKGIGESSLSGDDSYFRNNYGVSAKYYRLSAVGSASV